MMMMMMMQPMARSPSRLVMSQVATVLATGRIAVVHESCNRVRQVVNAEFFEPG